MAAKEKEQKKKSEFTVFQPNSRFNGILEYADPLRILGRFHGEIKGKEILEIGQQAEIEAHITAPEVIVFGSIKGNIVADSRVTLRKGARVIGNIRTPNLEIDDGVLFEGKCEMQQASKTA